MKNILLLLSIFCLVNVTYAADWYVDDNSDVGDVYTVGSAAGNDGAAGTALAPFATLGHAISVASANDNIYVDAGTYTDRTLTLSLDGVSIIGAGSTLVTFEANLGGSSSGIYFMNITGDNTTIQGITADGYMFETGGSGKAFTVNTGMTSSFTDVSAINSDGSGGDGAFYFRSGSTITFKSSNSSCNSGVATTNSGGLTVDGDNVTLNIDSCLIADNYSGTTSNGAGLKVIGGTDGSTVVTITNTSFYNNTGGHGGAIYVVGESVVDISNSCFDGNVADKGGIDPAYGGAICMGERSIVLIDNCTFENNTATASGSSDGGAIAIETGLTVSGSGAASTLSITNSSFTNNTASDDGNHIYGNESFSNVGVVFLSECTFDGVANAVAQRTAGEVTFQIANSGNYTAGAGNTLAIVNITPFAGSNTTEPTAVPVTRCQIQDGCGILTNCTPPAAPIGDAAQSFCVNPGSTVADLVATGTSIQWYDASSGGSLVAGVTALVNGTTYYASQTVGGCESTTRLAVTVTLTDPVAPTGDAAQSFCAIDNPTVADLVATGTSITWYDAASNGSAYLTTDGLVDGNTYYASQTTVGCESSTRLAVTVSLTDPAAPTGDAAQDFCAIDGSTVADLVTTSGAGIQWYDAATNGSVYLTTDILVEGNTYYASQTTGGCESTTRLAVTVTLTDPAAPTGDAAQSFCVIDGSTVADLATTTGSGIQWYDAATNGSVYLTTDILVDGNTYYASQTSGGCESTSTLAVTVSITDPVAPIGDANQSFCSSDNATIADLIAAGGSIVWYDAPAAGSAYLTTDALVDGGVYYASQVIGSCESATRLQVTVDITTSPAIPTASHTDPTCGSPTGEIDFDTQADVQYGLNGVYQFGEIFSGLAPATYTITVRSTLNNNCITSGVDIVIDPAAGAPAVPTYSLTQANCTTPTGTIEITSPLGEEYSIDGGVNFLAGSTFALLNPGQSIDLVVRNSLDNTCETIGDSFTMDALPNINVFTIEVQHNPCRGDAVGSAVVGSDGTAPFVFDWTGPGGFTLNPNANASGLIAGSYTVNVTDNVGCTGSLTFDINEAPSDLLANEVIANTTCGDSNGEITLAPSGGNGALYDIQWSDFTTDNPKQNLAAGDYDVTIIDGGGCNLLTTITVGASTAITVDAVNPQDVSCFGLTDGSLDLSTDGALPLTSVTWSDGQTTNDAVNLAAGSYLVTVVDANGCTGTSSSVDIDEPIELSATYALDSADCGIPNGQITVTPVGGTANYTVDWPVLGLLDQAVIGGLDVGGYNVLVTDANGCTFNDVVVMENPGDPNISILNQDNNLCFGDLNGSITVEADGGAAPYTFGWFDAAFNFITVGEMLSGLPTGTYYVMALDDNSCSDVELLVVTGPSAPVMASASTTSASCGDANGEISASALGGTAPYTYSLNGNSQSSGDFTGLSSGSQIVIVSDDNGCTDEITVALSNSDGPTLDEVQIEAPNCFNGADGSAYVLVQGGLPSYTYYQDGVQVTADVHNLTSGSNQILVVDAQLCSLYVDFVVPQADSLMAVIDTNFVLGDLPLSVEADGVNSIGESAYQWELNGELIGANSDVSEMIFEEGDYNLLLTVFEGICSDTTSITFTAENAYEWEIPNTFTPNGDGSNDNFRIKNSHNDFVTISIYNRWGELIYSFEGSNVNWDGRLKSGNFASAGTYFYILRYAETSDSEVSELNGYIRLVR